MNNHIAKFLFASVIAVTSIPSQPVIAGELEISPLLLAARGGNPNKPNNGGGGGGGDDGSDPQSPVYYSWMHSGITDAWDLGYLGQDSTITVVDDFSSRTKYFGNFGDGRNRYRHGEWTRKQASMIAPSAAMRSHEFTSGAEVQLGQGFNVINASYGWVELPSAFSTYDAQESSIIDYATSGAAFVSKSAGNDSIAVGGVIADGIYAGYVDYLSTGLIGTSSAVFVGALEHNGSEGNKASLASYSNYAGSNTLVQQQFLVVGVESGTTGLAGTSFAAPIVAGYAAVLSNKFSSATATQVADRLLDTALTDTIHGYDKAIHGMGEASIARAVAPDSIN